jgi:hypothetical protein
MNRITYPRFIAAEKKPKPKQVENLPMRQKGAPPSQNTRGKKVETRS